MSPTTILDEVNFAVAAMDWLTDADRAVVATIRNYANRIDEVNEDPESTPGDKSKAAYLGPHIVAAMKELGGTPVARGTAKPGGMDGKDSLAARLDALRKAPTTK